MAPFTLVDAEILAGPFRMTGRSNTIAFDLAAAELGVTNFDSGGWTEVIGGRSSMAASVDGHYDAAVIETGGLVLDEQLFGEVAGSRFPLTVAPTKADGSVAYVGGAKRATLSMFGQVGDVAPFSSDMWGDGAVGRGFLIRPANATVSASGTGTGRQLGATATGQTLLVAYHVLSLTGTSPTINITVQSDDNSGFTSAATVHNTGALSAPTAALVTAAGPITDDYYRVTWTLGGTTPVVRFAVAVALTPAP